MMNEVQTREAQAKAVEDGFKNAPRHTLTTGEIALLGGRQYNARVNWLRQHGHRIYCGRPVPGTQDYFYRWFGQQTAVEMVAEWKAKVQADRMLGEGFWIGPATGFQMWCPGTQEAAHGS